VEVIGTIHERAEPALSDGPEGRSQMGALTRPSEPGSARRMLSITVVMLVGLQFGVCQGKTLGSPSQMAKSDDQQLSPATDSSAEQELQRGTMLTRNGHFAEAIPHLLAARGRVANEYAASFNLALCYVGSGQFAKSIPILGDLRRAGHDDADVNNLLAQAYVGDGQDQKAFEALEKAASFTPANEKLYMFVADGCMGKQDYALGLRVVDLGLRNLPNSGRLHYERGMFLSLLDQFDLAKNDFDLAQKLAPESDIAFHAGAQEAMLGGDVTGAVRIARGGISKGHQDFMLLALLGEALLRCGTAPGKPEFEEARQALQKSILLRPNYASSHLALGKLHLLEGRAADAITHLEIARNLSPDDPTIYSQLAIAYRRHGDLQKAEQSLVTLATLNQAQAEKIRSAPGDRKASYGGEEAQGPSRR
jgi:tetratricopeptide (TPR) repeat protein